VDENEVPEWTLTAMQETIAHMRAARVEQALETAQTLMPALLYMGDYAEQARRLLELTRSTWPLAEYMQRHTAPVLQALESAGLLLQYADQVALLTDAGVLRPAPRHYAASATLTVTPTLTAQAEVVEAADITDVETQPGKRPATRRPIDFAVLAVQLVIAWALIFPMVAAVLPAGDQQIIANYIGTLAIALAVVWRYNDTHKH
jgi:hypothetical protein